MPYNPKHKPHLQFGAIAPAIQTSPLIAVKEGIDSQRLLQDRLIQYRIQQAWDRVSNMGRIATETFLMALMTPIEKRVELNAEVMRYVTACRTSQEEYVRLGGVISVTDAENYKKVLDMIELFCGYAGNSDAGGLMIVANEGGLKVIDSVAKKVAEALAADEETDKTAIAAAQAVALDEGKKAGVETGKAEGLSTGRLQGAVVGGIAGLVIGRMTTKG